MRQSVWFHFMSCAPVIMFIGAILCWTADYNEFCCFHQNSFFCTLYKTFMLYQQYCKQISSQFTTANQLAFFQLISKIFSFIEKVLRDEQNPTNCLSSEKNYSVYFIEGIVIKTWQTSSTCSLKIQQFSRSK